MIINWPVGVTLIIENEVQNDGQYLIFRIYGNYSFHDTIELIKKIDYTCRDKQIYKVLLDMSRLYNSNITDMDRFYLGEAVAQHWSSDIAVAAILPKRSINGYAETVARNRQARLKVTHTKQLALDWLLAEN